MGFTVTKSPPALVSPSEPTPSGKLPLSSIDRETAVRVMIDMVLVYEHGGEEEAGKVVRGALSRALVPYYPVAGRIVEPEPGELDVACTGDGVWFVEASADCTLEQVNHLEVPGVMPKDDLLPLPPPGVDLKDLIFLMQVTQFACGGLAVSIRFSHAVFDGAGVAQFLKAVAEMARGLPEPTLAPIWSRESIPTPPPKLPLPQALPPSFTTFPFVARTLDVSADTIHRIKNQCMRETGQKCSTFDVVTAMLWQARTRAANRPESSSDDGVVRLGFAADARRLLRQVLPREGSGYYGNCVFPVGVAAAGGTIASASLVEVVSMIRDAKERLGAKFLAWRMGEAAEEEEEEAYRVPMGYGTCVVADWRRVGLWEVDFGWGDPVRVAPLDDGDGDLVVASCIITKPPAATQGVRLLTRYVVEEDLGAFTDQFMKLA